MHDISLLVPEGEEAIELTSTVNLLAPVLSGHRAALGEVRRYPVFDRHAAVARDVVGDLPILVRVAGPAGWALVRPAIEVLGVTVPEARDETVSEWLLITEDPSADERALVDDVQRAFNATVLIAGYPSLPARTVAELGDRGLVLSAAESCTGGMLGEQITSVAGSSSVFWGSLVTYSYEAKSAVLGVESASLEAYGAVSEEVVHEMVTGVRRISGSDISVAISGIAGPGGGTEEKPVGTVWIACETSWSGVSTRLLELDGGRDRVRRDAVWECLSLVLSTMSLLDTKGSAGYI